METFKLHPTGRSEERNLIRKELSQDSKASRQSREASQTRRTRADKDAQRLRNAVECLRIAKAMSSVSFSGFSKLHLDNCT